jgi:hypothetical protein
LPSTFGKSSEVAKDRHAVEADARRHQQPGNVLPRSNTKPTPLIRCIFRRFGLRRQRSVQ